MAAVLGRSAGVDIAWAADVLVVRLSGVLTIEALRELAEHLDRGAAGSPAAAVIDFRGGVLACSGHELARLTPAAPGRRHMPIAYVAAGAAIEPLRRHCLHCDAIGVRRRVTQDPQLALDWAQALVRAAARRQALRR